MSSDQAACDTDAPACVVNHPQTKLDETSSDQVTENSSSVPIGIDLGTTNSYAAKYSKNGVEIVELQSDNMLPSCVFFRAPTKQELESNPSSCISYDVGEDAIQRADEEPKNFVSDAKRIIGRTWEPVSRDMNEQKWTFEIVEQNGLPVIKICIQDRVHYFTPQDISGIILGTIRQILMDNCRETIDHVVITVPARFNYQQRQDTVQAAKLAKFKNVALLSEPTAACIAHGVNGNTCQYVVVVDLGGGNLNIAIIIRQANYFSTLITHGDDRLGGQDFTNQFSDYCRTKFTNVPSNLDDKSKMELKDACERAKCELSDVMETKIVWRGQTIQVDRQELEDSCSHLFQRIRERLDCAIKKAHGQANKRQIPFNKSMINRLLLVGGSSRLVKMRHDLTTCFPEGVVSGGVHPDEAIARGAAIYAAFLAKADGKSQKRWIEDCLPYDLGIATLNDSKQLVFTKIVPQFSILPITMAQVFTTTVDNQKALKIDIYEGESPNLSKYHYLQTFRLEDIENATKGTPKIEIKFDIDKSGILKVTAKDRKTSSTNTIIIQHEDGISQVTMVGQPIEKRRKVSSGQDD